VVLPLSDDVDQEVVNGKISFKSEGFILDITYFEIPFTHHEQEVELANPNNTYREVIYIPNSVITYKLNSLQSLDDKSSKVGVKIKLELLDIDIYSGDYLIIGAGSEPKPRELSNVQIIAQNINNEADQKDIWVNADSAYIRSSISYD